MSVLNKLASALNRNDEAPNQQLAQEIAEAGDHAAVKELVANLANRDKAIQSDCIKVLYEVGERQPALIADYAKDFVQLLRSRNNRLVWGAMTALGQIAHLKAGEIWQQIDLIISTTQNGSAITEDWGIRVLATVSAADKTYEARLFPFLVNFLQTCRPKDLPRHTESAVIAVTAANRESLLAVLEARQDTLKPAQTKRLGQLIRKIKAL